jgi:hypothetical protein
MTTTKKTKEAAPSEAQRRITERYERLKKSGALDAMMLTKFGIGPIKMTGELQTALIALRDASVALRSIPIVYNTRTKAGRRTSTVGMTQ